jgi:hypothetical protein
MKFQKFGARLFEGRAAFLWYFCSFTTEPIVRSNIEVPAQGLARRLPEGGRFVQTAIAEDKLNVSLRTLGRAP